MPTIRHGALTRLAGVAAVAAALAVPSGALADSGATCNLPATSPVFSDFGDANNYYLAAGGGFEYGLTNLLTGGLGGVTSQLAWVGTQQPVTANDPYDVSGGRDATSVRLRYGTSMFKTAQCVSADQPHLRFMARSLGSGPLTVRVDTVDLNDVVRSATTVIPASEHATWGPTRFVTLDTAGMPASSTGLATITISSQGDWLVDDVYIDPYAR